jgi:hypothetical protein
MLPSSSEARAVPAALPWPFRYLSVVAGLATLGWIAGIFVFTFGRFTEQVNVAVYGTFMMALFGLSGATQFVNAQREFLERRIAELERKLEAKS